MKKGAKVAVDGNALISQKMTFLWCPKASAVALDGLGELFPCQGRGQSSSVQNPKCHSMTGTSWLVGIPSSWTMIYYDCS